jgi:hypothetical protein
MVDLSPYFQAKQANTHSISSIQWAQFIVKSARHQPARRARGRFENRHRGWRVAAGVL